MTQNRSEPRSKFDPQYGKVIQIAPNIERVVAPNPSGFTFTGTNSYIVSSGSKAVIIDPGPGEEKAPKHLETLLRGLGARELQAIILTHTHRDHCEHVPELLAAKPAPLIGFGPHKLHRELAKGESNPLKDSNKTDLDFDNCLSEGETVEINGLTLQAIHTPGHAPNHICLAVSGTPYLFSGDLVMGWSTCVIAPPEGHMGSFIRSLERLSNHPQNIYFPGHGDRVDDAHKALRATKNQKQIREQAVLNQIEFGLEDVLEITKRVYNFEDEAKIWAASLNVRAHIESLVERGLIAASIGAAARRN